MTNDIFVCCKQADCPNNRALYFISQEQYWLSKLPCPLCGEAMEKTTDPEEGASGDKAEP